MKNIWKVLAAMMVVALPFIASSCGSDDDNGPWTLTYNWKLEGVDMNEVPIAELGTVGQAITNIDSLIAQAYRTAGFKINGAQKQFSVVITTDDEITIGKQDSKANNTFMELVGTSAFQDEVYKISVGTPKMYIWRDGKEIISHMAIKQPRQEQ